MPKEVYIPTYEQLHKMQEIAGANNLYTYLLVKTVESLIINRKSGKSILEGTTEALREDYYISTSISYLYPEEVVYSEIAQYEIQLAEKILEKSKTNQIYNIDEIRHFDSSTIYANNVVKKVIGLLKKELINCPKYRFEYLDNPLLDSIFAVDVESLKGFHYDSVSDELTDLIEIEPAYGIILPDGDFHSDTNRRYRLIQGIEQYSRRHNISSLAGSNYYYGKDILSNPDKNVKRLLKCINKRQ